MLPVKGGKWFGGLLGSGLVDHPLEAVCCRVGLVAALALMPVIGVVILPLCAVAVGMAGRRILIGGLNLHSACGHGEGGVGCDSNITRPFVELLPGGGGVRSQSNLCAGGNICAVVSTAVGHGDGIGLCGSITAVLAHAIFHRMGFRDAVIARGAILGVLVFIKLCIGVP